VKEINFYNLNVKLSSQKFTNYDLTSFKPTLNLDASVNTFTGISTENEKEEDSVRSCLKRKALSRGISQRYRDGEAKKTCTLEWIRGVIQWDYQDKEEEI
jgi:hypothetical protein